MLEQMRRQGASIFVYLIFCLLIAIFIINFRPGQSRQGDNGCGGDTNQVVNVDGKQVTATAYHIAYSNPYNRGQQKQRVWLAIEGLISRELLAQEAERRGLRASTELLEEQYIKKGYFFVGGARRFIPGIFDEDHLWSLRAFKGWIGQLNVSKNSYETEQQRGLLAWMMGQTLTDSVQVTRDEAKAEYDYDHTLVSYDVVTFDPGDYKSAMHPSDADLDRYIASHADAVKQRYESDKRTWTVKKQYKLREIFIGKSEAPPADEKKDDKKKDDKKPAGMTIDEAKAKLEAARAQIVAGKLKFADAAKELSTTPALKASGGDAGWQTVDSPTLDEKAVNDAVKDLKVGGEPSPVITTDTGAYLLVAEDQREGELKFDQVKREIAAQLATPEWSQEAARRDAIKALTAAQGGKKLDQQFEREQSEPNEPPFELKKRLKMMQQLINSKQVPDETRNMIYDQIQQIEQSLRMQRAQILAAREVWSKDQPAAWYADGDGAGAGASAGSGSGSGSAAATPAPPPAPPKVDLMKPSTDPLPAFPDMKPPKVIKQGPAPRSHVMPGIGKSKEIADALFDTLAVGEVPKTIYEVERQRENVPEHVYVVIQLVDKQLAKAEDFDKEAAEDIAELREQRAASVLETWLRDRCETLAKDQRITPNMELLRETNDKGEPIPTQYRLCMYQ